MPRPRRALVPAPPFATSGTATKPSQLQILLYDLPRYVPGRTPPQPPITLLPRRDAEAFIVDKVVTPLDGAEETHSPKAVRRLLNYVVGWPDEPYARQLVPCTEILDYVAPRVLEDWEYALTLRQQTEKEAAAAAADAKRKARIKVEEGKDNDTSRMQSTKVALFSRLPPHCAQQQQPRQGPGRKRRGRKSREMLEAEAEAEAQAEVAAAAAAGGAAAVIHPGGVQGLSLGFSAQGEINVPPSPEKLIAQSIPSLAPAKQRTGLSLKQPFQSFAKVPEVESSVEGEHSRTISGRPALHTGGPPDAQTPLCAKRHVMKRASDRQLDSGDEDAEDAGHYTGGKWDATVILGTGGSYHLQNPLVMSGMAASQATTTTTTATTSVNNDDLDIEDDNVEKMQETRHTTLEERRRASDNIGSASLPLSSPSSRITRIPPPTVPSSTRSSIQITPISPPKATGRPSPASTKTNISRSASATAAVAAEARPRTNPLKRKRNAEPPAPAVQTSASEEVADRGENNGVEGLFYEVDRVEGDCLTVVDDDNANGSGVDIDDSGDAEPPFVAENGAMVPGGGRLVRLFLVRWKGDWPPDQNPTWEPAENLPPRMVRQYLKRTARRKTTEADTSVSQSMGSTAVGPI
ncbi:chromatin organization modifier, chromo domain containing protein [Niveomyces insectorum RCEF 264]|uniref:Chromatin organization modifier, chromo domain containing protein n=1 Tax=Niveomyces insectorum RCEF 264 TaxID=1081102 RepID=A0A167M593_9HYPO|nr:chromatin organization modifier, chromo domain containing protein [Niveomyces insectorum RCEF 264]